jgi:hypothetical protein
MTEQEYTDACDLTRIRLAKQMLISIVPTCSKVIIKKDWQEVLLTLHKWEEALETIVVTKP